MAIKRVEIFFVVLILVFGTVLVMITPLGGGTDEETHFARIWEMSRGTLIPNQYFSTGAYYPYTFFELSYRQDVNLKPISWKAWKAQLSVKIDWDNMLDKDTRARYFPTFYLPQAFIMGLLGRVFDTPVAIIYYIERFSYLFTYAFLIYLAIRITPVGKWVFGVLSILPMSLILASTVTADALNNGIAFIFIAWVLYLIVAGKTTGFSKKEWFITALLTFAVCTLKLNALPLLLILFLIPRNKFGPRPWFIAFIVFTLFSILVVGIGWNYVTSSFLLNSDTGDSHSAIAGLKGIIADPGQFLRALFGSILTKAPRYAREWIGVSGYDYWLLPAPVYWLTPIIVLAAILSENMNNVLERRNRNFLLITFLIVFVGTWILFYLLYNSPGSLEISGVQGRYFIAIGPLLVVPLIPAKQVLNIKNIWLQVGSILIAGLTVGGLFLAYHVTCGSAYYSFGMCLQPSYKNWSPETSLSVNISTSTTVKQTFISTCDEVSQVEFWINKKGISQDPLLIGIQLDGTSEVVGSKVIPPGDVPSLGWLVIDFPSSIHSGNKKMILEIAPADKLGNPAVDFAYSSTDEYLDGSLTFNNQPQIGDLLFKYGCRVGLENLFH